MKSTPEEAGHMARVSLLKQDSAKYGVIPQVLHGDEGLSRVIGYMLAYIGKT
jgi:hypothetical protein